MKTRNGEITPQGRITEYADREDAELLAYSPAGQWDYKVRRFNSRKALEAFCKDGSAMHAVVKSPVSRQMLINRNIQRLAN